jgi:anti-anti-sigma regulatory factor
MDITFSKAVGNVDVTVMHLDGQLDGQTYQSLIKKANEVYIAGARNFLLDLSGLTYISSAGLAALHAVALLARGETVPDSESGWATLRSMGSRGTSGKSENVKLLNPRDDIVNVLEMVGFNNIFEIFMDFDEAVKSF